MHCCVVINCYCGVISNVVFSSLSMFILSSLLCCERPTGLLDGPSNQLIAVAAIGR